MSNGDDTEIDSEAESESESDRQPQFTPDGFTAVLAILTAGIDARATLAHVRKMQKAQAKAEAALATLAEREAAFQAYESATRAELAEEKSKIARLHAATRLAETMVNNREDRIKKLEDDWRFVGESDDLVRRGLRGPFDTPLGKAVAHAKHVRAERAAEGAEVDDPAPETETIPPPDTSLTREIDPATALQNDLPMPHNRHPDQSPVRRRSLRRAMEA
jgi:hypothetical protein